MQVVNVFAQIVVVSHIPPTSRMPSILPAFPKYLPSLQLREVTREASVHGRNVLVRVEFGIREGYEDNINMGFGEKGMRMGHVCY
jgi:hypothetical protein